MCLASGLLDLHLQGWCWCCDLACLLCSLLHVYLFIEINYLIQGLVMGSARMNIIILPGKVSAASHSHEFIPAAPIQHSLKLSFH